MTIELDIDRIQPSEVNLRERTLMSLLLAHQRGEDDKIAPIMVVFDAAEGRWVVWDGNTRLFVAAMMGQDKIQATVVPMGTEGETDVLRGARACQDRGIRSVRHLNPIDILVEDRWRSREIHTYQDVKMA